MLKINLICNTKMSSYYIIICILIRYVAPKKASAEAASASLKEKQLALSAAQEKLADLQKLLSKLKEDFKNKMIEKEQLIKKVNIIKN